MPDEDSVVAFDPAIRRIAPTHFLANGDVLSLNGTHHRRIPQIEIRAGDTVRASAVSGADGVFRVNVPLTRTTKVRLRRHRAVGLHHRRGFRGDGRPGRARDRLRPVPAAPDRRSTIRIAGTTEPDATLTLNGTAVALDGGRFDETVTLKPGSNQSN